jgi:flagellar biosynthesis/type III secretory pathway protein FliH
MSDDDNAFDWLPEDEEADEPTETQEEPKLKSAKDFLKRKIQVRKATKDSPEYTRGYRDGYYAAIEENKSKWYNKGWNDGLEGTALPDN